MRILYSFPHRIGAGRICYTAWEQVRCLSESGIDVLLMAGSQSRPLPNAVSVWPTLSRGKYRVPYRLLGKRALQLHDLIVARRLKSLVGKIDVVHCWPSGALETLKEAKRRGIPTVLERPNAHTRYCYETVGEECKRIGVQPHDDYVHRESVLRREEAEFAAPDYLLCPSEFSAKTFRDKGFTNILRHRYGYDENRFFPDIPRDPGLQVKIRALWVGVDAVRKGLHHALEAWIYSPAIHDGMFLIAGELSSEFKKKFAYLLEHPSVVQLGHRSDVPYLMRTADILMLPTLEEGSPLVCMEAIGSGCIPLVSTVCEGVCRHGKNALIHNVGDVETLRKQITELHCNPELMAHLRKGCVESRDDLTWSKAADTLKMAYEDALRRRAS